jgi:hypothetical protein
LIPSGYAIKPSSAPYAARTYADYVDNNSDDGADDALHFKNRTSSRLAEHKVCRPFCQ